MKREQKPFLTEEKKQQYLRAAEQYKDLSFDFLWESVPSQMIPRSYAVTKPQTTGCLQCGHSAMEHGNYPYILDYINNRWKIVCPSCGLTFPTNDFESYYKGGLNEQGMFDVEKAKRHNDELIAKGEKGNLVNILYPEKGEKWGVDDGTCYVHTDGTKYMFIAYYGHFFWNQFLPNILGTFRNAYLASGDIQYAEKAIVLLDRVADVYPSLSLARWRYDESYMHSDGCGRSKGKAIGSIWETGLATSLLTAIRTFGEVLEKDLAPNAVAFLNSKNKERKIKDSAEGIWDNLMLGIVLQIYPAVMTADIHGNVGMHQRALSLAAVIWDKMPETKEWLDFCFRTGLEDPIRRRLMGGNLSSVLVDRVDRDGYGNESSPGYNSIWLNSYAMIADVLDGYELAGMENYDLYKHPKFRKMLTTMYPLILSDIYTARIGDSAACGNPYYTVSARNLIKAFLKFGNPEFAQAAYFMNRNKLEGMDLSEFSESPEAIAEKIRAVIAEKGELKLGGTNLTGYGLIALRDGCEGDMFIDPKTTTQRALTVYYGKNYGHGHQDTLFLDLYAYGLNVTPDMGYPRYADMLDMHRQSVTVNTISHNTVMINDQPQTIQTVGDPLHFDVTERVKLYDVASETAYKDIAETYRRSGAMIRINEQDSYVIDFFRVSGGSKHTYSFHGAEQNGIATEGLTLIKQADANGNYIGTYAGADTTYPVNSDVRDLSGARYLINIDKQTGTVGDFSVDYSLLDTWNILGGGENAPTDIHLKLTMLGKFDEVMLADMLPPENKVGNPKALRYVFAARKGENLQSCYTAVIEPYRGKSKIAAIEAMTVTENGQAVCPMCARAVKVTLTSGRVDYIVNAVDPAAVYTVSDGETEFAFSGFFGVWSREGGCNSYYLNDGTQIGAMTNTELPAITGTVVDFTRELAVENEIVVSVDQANIVPEMLSEKLINIEGEPNYNAAYQIKSAAFRGDGKLVLNIGDVTPIRCYADKYDFAKGYIYDIVEGRSFRIPLTACGK